MTRPYGKALDDCKSTIVIFTLLEIPLEIEKLIQTNFLNYHHVQFNNKHIEMRDQE